jgi:hypothetical protein
MVSVSQAMTEFLQAIAIAAGRGMRRDLEQFADRLKGQVMPELQDDDLALLGRQSAQGLRGGFGFRRSVRVWFKPAVGFLFPDQSPPQTPSMI